MKLPPGAVNDADSLNLTADFLGVVPEQPAGCPPSLEVELAGQSLRSLLEREPLIVQCMRFMKAESFLELASPCADPGEGAFGMPEPSDALVFISQARASLCEEKLADIKSSVREILGRSKPGCRCFVFCESLCGRKAHDAGEATYSRLRLKVAMHADVMLYLSAEKRPCVAVDGLGFEEDGRSATDTDGPEGEEQEAGFGPTGSAPGDDCGKVHPEHCARMAKAAMVGEDERVEKAAWAPSPPHREPASTGAEVLSDAACAGHAVPPALDFSRTPIEEPTSAESARSIPSSAFDRLDTGWDQEAQQRRSPYALRWLAPSPARVQAIEDGSRPNIVPFCVVGGLPVVLALLLFALPYDRPDAGYPTDGFLQNPRFVFYCWPATQLPCWYLFPEWVRMAIFPELSPLRGGLWTAATTAAVSLGIGALSASMEVFPVPFLTVVNITAVMPFLPLIWYCLPREVRARQDSGRRLSWGLLGLALLIAVFGMFFPLFNAAFQLLEGIYQNIAVLVFLSARVAFEKINKTLARRLGPDMYPVSVALAVYAYEFSMCMMMGCVKDPLVVAICVGADVCENAFHLWCIWKKRYERGSVGSCYCIVSVLLLRECVELVVPAQLLIILTALQFGPAKQFNHLVSAFPQGMPAEFRTMLIYLTADLLVEAAMFAVVCCVLRAQGFKPLLLLRGVLNANLGSYFAIAAACIMFYLQLQHSHFGCDFSFEFIWGTREKGVAWSYGLAWSTSDAP